MHWSIQAKINLGLAVSLVIVGLLGALTYQTARELVENSRDVEHSRWLMNQLHETLSLVVDAETGTRGYLITGNEDYLAPYKGAAAQMNQQFALLRQLTAADAEQRRHLVLLQEAVRQKLAYQEEIVQLRKAEGGKVAFERVSSGHGKMLMDNIRYIFAQMIDRENELLRQESKAAQASASKTRRVVYVFVFLTVLLVLAGYERIRRDLKARARAEQNLRESQEKVRLLLDSTAEAMYGIDLNGICTFCNPATLRLLGHHDSGDLLGQKMHDLIHHSHPDGSPYPADKCRIYQAFREGKDVHVEGEVFWRTDGTCFPCEYWSYPIRQGERLMGAVVTFMDITERVTNRKALQEANLRLSQWVKILEGRTDEITTLRQFGSMLQSCLTAEEAYRGIKEYSQKLFPAFSGGVYIATASRNLLECVASWGESEVGEKTFAPDDCWALRSGRPNCVEDKNSAAQCRHVPSMPEISYLCVPLIAQGDALGILHIQCPAKDTLQSAEGWTEYRKSREELAAAVAEQVALALANLRLRETLRSQSIRDALTDLFNRRYMEESLEREILRASRNNWTIGALLLDIDHFKRYNDAFGHEAGDALLREVGAFLKKQVRGEDIPCRYGGEEFVLIMPGAPLEIAQQRAERLREGVKKLKLNFRGRALGAVTLSLGVAMYPSQGLTAESLLRAADTALYAAKENGRDCVVLSTATPEEP